MSARNDGGPAFPITGTVADNQFNGMSLRDYFAAKALQGMLANTDKEDADWHAWGHFMPTLAANAYEAADAMLRERDR